jgi:hypothetical protein
MVWTSLALAPVNERDCCLASPDLESKQLQEYACDPAVGPDKWDPDGKYVGSLGPRKLSGASLLDFSQRQIEVKNTLLYRARLLASVCHTTCREDGPLVGLLLVLFCQD